MPLSLRSPTACAGIIVDVDVTRHALAHVT